jgi:D-glycero-D-manno-heptose 1,7-bisphosphate phosphatase
MSQQRRAGQVVILDRDGTIIVDRDYLDDPDKIEFSPGAIEGLQLLREQGCRFIVVTNQSGIGRGFFSLDRLQQVHDRLREMLHLEGIDGCKCRKPGIALINQAAADLHFEPSSAIVIGDKASDVECGRRVGATTILISENRQETAGDAQADFYTKSFDGAARAILGLLALKRLAIGSGSARRMARTHG